MINTQVLQQQISQKLSGFKDGYFATIDSSITLGNTEVNSETLYKFSEKAVKNICDAMNRFAFGRAYVRGEKRLRIVSAIEVGGETGRLHAHILFSHLGGCLRTLNEFRSRLGRVCKIFLNAGGSNAIHVEPFDHARDWSTYFVKQTAKIYARYNGFANVGFY